MRRSILTSALAAAALILGLPFAGMRALGDAPATQPADALHFHQVSIQDTQMNAGEACTLQIPDGWKTDGGIVWDVSDINSPATFKLRVSDPAGTRQTAFYPAFTFFWSDNPMVQQAQPKGSRYVGALVEAVPADCKDALLNTAWPMTHDKIPGLKVVSFQLLPDLAKAYEDRLPADAGVQHTTKAGRLRVEYADPKTSAMVDEDLVGVLLLIPTPATQSTMWTIDSLTGYKAPAGQLDDAELQMEPIGSSLAFNIQWFADYLNAQQVLVNMQAGDALAAMQRAAIEFHAQNKITQTQQQAFEYRARSAAKSNLAWDRIIRASGGASGGGKGNKSSGSNGGNGGGKSGK